MAHRRFISGWQALDINHTSVAPLPPAVYAQRSGLVSLASLRRQLQHITDEMSRYYARGSAYARNIIGNDKHHFGFEWQDTQSTSSALSYMLNPRFSIER